MGTSVGQIYGRTLEIIKERFGPLLGLWATFIAVQIGLMLIFAVVVGASAAAGFAGGDPGALSAGVIFAVIIFYFVYILVYLAQSASMTALASPLQRLSFGDAFNAGIRSAPTMLGVLVLLMIAYFVVALVVGLIGGILAFAGKFAVGLLVVLLIPAAIYLACRLSTVNAVVAVERVSNPITAISRGWSMTEGNVLTIFLALLGYGVIAGILLLLVAMPFISAMAGVATTGMPPSFGGMGLSFVGLFIVSIVLAVVGSALLSVIHGEISGPGAHNTQDVFN